MRVSKSVVVGLISLVCAVSATKVTGKPVLAKRQALVTVTNKDCTAVCDTSGAECDVWCQKFGSTDLTTTSPATSTSPSTSTLTLLSTVYPSSEATLDQRTVISAVDGDCTAVCWDLMPGTECDVQCSSDFKTNMPVPSKAARVANLEARENVPAHQVREARLARKFGDLVARDEKMTVTVTSIPEYCTAGPESSITTTVAGIPTILPMQVPHEAGASEMSPALSQVSAAASSALSEAGAFLSSMAAPGPISANATVAMPAPTGSAPTVSATSTATSTSSETTTVSTTTNGSPSVSEAGVATTSIFSAATGGAPEHSFSAGLVLSLLVALAANVAFLI